MFAVGSSRCVRVELAVVALPNYYVCIHDNNQYNNNGKENTHTGVRGVLGGGGGFLMSGPNTLGLAEFEHGCSRAQ